MTLPELGRLVGDHAWTPLALLFLAVAAWEVLRPRQERAGEAIALHWATSLALYGAGLALLALAAPAVPWLGLGLAAHGAFAAIERLGGHALVLLAGILALDLYNYLSHRVQHVIGPLWRLHAVHHADEHPNALTALRHHPLIHAADALAALLLLAGLLGLPLWVFPLYALLWRAVNLLAHANIALPDRVERWLGRVFVTPRMHRVHHSADTADFDTNFGAALSVWDRLFGTLRVRERDVEAFGVPGFRGAAYSAGWRGLAVPWALPFLRGHSTTRERPAREGATPPPPRTPPAEAPP